MNTRTLGCDDVNVTELAQKGVSHKASLLTVKNFQVHVSEFSASFTRHHRIELKNKKIENTKNMQINPQLL
jgi:hypothetical protein